MSAVVVSTYDPKQGRAQDLAAVLHEAVEYMTGVGGSAQVRDAWLAGEVAGTYQMITQFPSVDALMEGLDRIIADVANNPLRRAHAVENAPATLRSRYTSATLTADAPIAEPAAVMGYTVYQIAPGARDEARAAFAAAEERHAGLGFATRAFQITNGGSASGAIVYAVPAGSYAEFGTFIPKNQELGPGPLLEAVAAGQITLISQLNSRLLSA